MSEKKTKKTTTNIIAESKEITLIYCGPTLRNGELQQYAVFRGALPKHVIKHVESSPAVKELFVSTKDFVHVKAKVEIKGSRENLLYTKALEYAKGGKN